MHANQNPAGSKLNHNFPIVGIGASAGGLEAFQKFVEAIGRNSGMAFVMVQHLAPTHDSLLPEILQNHTELPVYEITDDIVLEPNSIYIIPENKILKAFDGVLKLTPRNLALAVNKPIDIFFKSLAEVHQSFALGVILSGTGFDGTAGLKYIKEAGGITYAQSTDSAHFDSMPQNAIDSGAVDFILPPGMIPGHLLHVKQAYTINHAYEDSAELPVDHDEVFRQIIRVLRLHSGTDFTHYKQPTLRRRIARRMVATSQETPLKYLNFLRKSTEEQELLFNDVLIPVSYFFRDGKSFELAAKTVFEAVIHRVPQSDSIRIWCAGCSTGEEAYSIAIAMHEFLEANSRDLKVQIFATDLSEKVINKARAAKYGKEELQNVSESRLQKYFTKANGFYHVNKIVRDMCVFAVHNFLKDPPFSKVDLVSCRNVLIYLDSLLQKKALSMFHYSLREEGHLFLGNSESTTNGPKLFEPVAASHKIFRRNTVEIKYRSVKFKPQEVSFPAVPILKRGNDNTDVNKVAQSMMIARYTPASVIIDAQQDIIHFHGDTSPFLVPAAGKPNLNLIKMAREGLAFELRNALLKTQDQNEVVKKGIHCKGTKYLIDFEILPLPHFEKHFLVVLHKHDIVPREKSQFTQTAADKERIGQLEAELEQLREDIRTVNEDQEAVYEELQSANEELLSSSEELQSLNEELETSAEELQSTNEELTSVNDELMDRQNQLISARIEAEAIVETIREPLVIVDSNLRIKSANHAFYKYFKLSEKNTEGVSIFNVGSVEWYSPELRILLENILPEKSKVEDYEVTGSFSGLGQRTLLINAKQIINTRNPDQLLLLAFEDITERKISTMLLDNDEHFRIMANTAPVLLWLSDNSRQFTFFNKSWLDYTGRTLEQEQGLGWLENLYPDDKKRFLHMYKGHFDARKEFTMELRLMRNDGEYRWISCKGVPRVSPDGQFIGYAGGCMDIHEQKDFAVALEAKVHKRTKEFRDSEAFLQSILNTTQNLIYLYDFEKEKVIFINKKAFETTGYTSDEIKNAKTDIFTKIIHEEDLQDVLDQRRLLRESTAGTVATVEFRVKNKNGDYTFQLSRDLVFKRDNKGNALQYIGVATDITDIKQANDQLIVKNQELEHSNIELASFSSIASHDLKEPLRKIQIFSKLVIANDSANFSEESKEFLERVIVSANRMQQLIDDLISYSRTSSQKIIYTESDLNLLLNEVLEDLREVITESKAKIDIADMPFASVIPSQFRQLFVNLLSNAIKYHRAGVLPHIKIYPTKATSSEILAIGGNPELSYLKISVTDNGIGFAKEFQNRIFEPFQRLHGKDEYTGTGIGLAICKKIMVNHSGFITAESEEGKGACFYIYVPDLK